MTVEEKAKEYAFSCVCRSNYPYDEKSSFEGYLAGYTESMRWRDPKVELPVVYNGCSAYENKDLVIVKLSKYDSYEFAVLIKVNEKLMWDIPDKGFFELKDIIGWRPIE